MRLRMKGGALLSRPSSTGLQEEDIPMEYIGHPLIVTYEELGHMTALDPDERMRDELLLDSAHRAVEGYLDRVLTRRAVSQRTETEDGVIPLYHYPVVSVDSVTDAETGAQVMTAGFGKMPGSDLYCVFAGPGAPRVTDVTYVAGYAPGELPAVFAEAVVKTFLYKRNAFGRLEAGEASHVPEDAVSDEVKAMLGPYRRKTW